uniref:Uncharacterized protein n=1 Tax=Fagus sylvatica TaxID=28930 RepID=A0A2N9ICD8_FAGSY
MRGGRVGFIENRARLACTPCARMTCPAAHDGPRELWYCHVANPPRSSAQRRTRILFYPIFGGSFGGLLELKLGHAAYRRKALSTSSFQRYKVCTNRSSDEGVMAPGSRGIGAVFVHTLPAKIPIKRGMLSANREFHDVAGVIIFPTHPGSRINLLRAGKTLRAKAALPMSDFDVLGTVGKRRKACAAYFCKVPDSRESELRLVRYGPASRVHRGVFGPFEGSFPIRIPADPDKFLAIREFHVVHGCVLFPMCARARRSTCCESGRLCAQARQRRWENSGNFSTALFRRPVFTRVVDVAPDVGFRRSWYRRKAYDTYFLTVQALRRGELGFARYDPANGGRRNVPYAKGSTFGLRFRLDRRSS